MAGNSTTANQSSPVASFAIFAWNEEAGIATTLDSLLKQTIFPRLAAEGKYSEVFCVLNGCTDNTARVARDFFADWKRQTPFSQFVHCEVADIREKGKLNAWNQYVHGLSARRAEMLFMMDADIIIHLENSLWNMRQTLEQNPDANVAVDLPCKDISFKSNQGLRDSVSLGMAGLTRNASAQLCGQLYAIRAATARNIYLPRGLSACEDGFIKSLVCTDSLTRPINNARIQLAPEAAHTFEAYTSIPAILKNQKRQMIGQTIVHILVDRELQQLSEEQKTNLADVLRQRELQDPAWLKKKIAAHMLNVRFFWQLYPGLLGQRWKSLRHQSLARKMRLFPAALLAFISALPASFMACRALKSGATNYWPRAERSGFKTSPNSSQTHLSTNKSIA